MRRLPKESLDDILKTDLTRDPFQQIALAVLMAGSKPGIKDRMATAMKAAVDATKNIARDSARERRRQGRNQPILIPEDEPTVPSFLDHIADIDQCKRLLDRLPPELGSALAHYYLYGLTHDEIASKSGITVEGVRSRLRRAKDVARM